jgi:hypothetical protein
MKYVQPPGAHEGASYVDFNPAIGQEGSVVPAYAIEAPMREIVSAIIEAGLEPAEGNLAQLAAAIRALIDQSVGQTVATQASLPGERLADLPVNSEYSVPTYTVGLERHLFVYWNGYRCFNGQQYLELGQEGAASTTIKWLMPVLIADSVNVEVVTLTNSVTA